MQSQGTETIHPLYKNLIDDELWERLVARLVKEQEIEHALAERAIDGALGFVKLCGEHAGEGFTPSKLVDLGWHTFILYTREYFEFCRKYSNHGYVHHEPTDRPGVKHEGPGPRQTIAFMMLNGIPFDAELWTMTVGFDSTSNCCATDCRAGNNGWCNGS